MLSQDPADPMNQSDRRVFARALFASLAVGAAALAYAGIAVAGPLQLAQSDQPKVAPDRCLALAQAPSRGLPARVMQAAVPAPGKLMPYQARVTFWGHATFVIESPKGVRAATDYAVTIPEPFAPDIVTMNNSHSSHWTAFPQEGITHVLRGWNPAGGAALHDVTMKDFRVRNVPTNARDWGGGTRVYGNSIFIYEVGSMCMAHLGHLHHTLTMQQLANIGQMDVLFVPVDGSWTLDYPGLLQVIKTMNPRYVVPMHYFTRSTLDRFLGQVGQSYAVREIKSSTHVFSKDKMPLKTEVLVIPSRHGHNVYSDD